MSAMNADASPQLSLPEQPAVRPAGIHHVRLTVTDIARSKAFYTEVFGSPPAVDFSDQAGDPAVRADPHRLYGGCFFIFGQQVMGLRPVAPAGDRFDSTRVGLDHLSFTVDSPEALAAASARLDATSIAHGVITELAGFGLQILSLQDPDDINLELVAVVPPA
jgi:glyoxylase I family protein